MQYAYLTYFASLTTEAPYQLCGIYSDEYFKGKYNFLSAIRHVVVATGRG